MQQPLLNSTFSTIVTGNKRKTDKVDIVSVILVIIDPFF